MNSIQRNTALREAGYNATVIAQAMEKNKSTVSAVISGKGISLPIAKTVALILNVPVEEAFEDIEQYQPEYSPAKVKAAKVAELKQRLDMAS